LLWEGFERMEKVHPLQGGNILWEGLSEERLEIS
jgi:hypothetical protein